jgi:hypothetical protein
MLDAQIPGDASDGGYGVGRQWGRMKGAAPAVLGVHALDEGVRWE